MLGAKKRYQLRDFIFGKSVFEAGHLHAAVDNLIGHLSGGDFLADVDERRSLLRPLKIGSMTIGATLIAEEDAPGGFAGFGAGRICRSYGNGCPGQGSQAADYG